MTGVVGMDYRRRRAKFMKRLKATGLNVRVLGKFVKYQALIEVECLDCGNVWFPNGNNLVQGHGCPSCGFENREKTLVEKHGKDFKKVFRKNFEKTMMSKYGVTNALQVPEFFEKNLKTAYLLKTYRLGKRKVLVQGFEPFALDYLLEEKGVDPEDIIVGNDPRKPKIEYVFDGKKRVYHPDIYIRSLNHIVEVKSEYTIRVATDVNIAKKRACKKAGFKFMFLVMDKQGRRINVN